MTNYRPVKGDRVRVVLEAVLTDDGSDCLCNDRPRLAMEYLDHAPVVSIEKIEPPVVTFKPGDVVRGKRTGPVYAIGKGGRYTVLKSATLDPGYVGFAGEGYFSSRRFELVSLG